jgi:exopolysaccharide biosynthesis WecB/TagA/CpsF family protein
MAAVRSDVVLFGIPSWNPTYEEFYAWFCQVTQSEDRHNIAMCLANAHTFNLIKSQPRYKQCIQSMDLVLNDGIGFRLASQMRGVHVRYNFNGTDLIPRLLDELEQPLRVFLYGATEESNELATQKLLARYPRMVCAGHLGGFVSDDEAATMIGNSNADLVLVAKGNPKQEQFIIEYRDRLNCKLAVGVGGLFDFVSELKPRAPKLFRASGMEWAYRLMLEPRRMFRRYVIGNPVFLVRALFALPGDKDRQASLNKSS